MQIHPLNYIQFFSWRFIWLLITTIVALCNIINAIMLKFVFGGLEMCSLEKDFPCRGESPLFTGNGGRHGLGSR